MTYREIAAARGITHAAAIRLVQRHRWPKREGSNDGLAHVLVPHDAVQPTPPVRRPRQTDQASPSRGTSTPPATGPFETALAAIEAAQTSEISAFRAQADAAEQSRLATQALADQALTTIADLTARMDAAVSIADRATSMAADAAARADRAEAAITAERARADTLRDRLEQAQADLAVAQHDAETAQQAAAKANATNALLEVTQKELAGQRALTDAARQDAQAVQEWAAGLRQTEAARKARGRLRRAWDGWRGR
jgi:hypothetical protein